MYSLGQISLYLLCFYMWALVQLYIRSRVEDSFPPIPYMPWLGGLLFIADQAARNNTEQTSECTQPAPWTNLSIRKRLGMRVWRTPAPFLIELEYKGTVQK